MGDKPIAMLVAAAVAAPVCLVCIFGPAVLGSAVAWISGWSIGLGPVLATGLAVAAAGLIYRRTLRRKSAAREGEDGARRMPRPVDGDR